MDEKPRVAFVDDDPRLRSLIAEELLDEGVHPVAFSSGQELLECVEAEEIDLILIDLMMPVMDGLTCLRQLNKRTENVPILVVTAFNDDVKRQESVAGRGNSHSRKLHINMCNITPSLLLI